MSSRTRGFRRLNTSSCWPAESLVNYFLATTSAAPPAGGSYYMRVQSLLLKLLHAAPPQQVVAHVLLISVHQPHQHLDAKRKVLALRGRAFVLSLTRTRSRCCPILSKNKMAFTEDLVIRSKLYQNTSDNSVFDSKKSLLKLCKKVDYNYLSVVISDK